MSLMVGSQQCLGSLLLYFLTIIFYMWMFMEQMTRNNSFIIFHFGAGVLLNAPWKLGHVLDRDQVAQAW